MDGYGILFLFCLIFMIIQVISKIMIDRIDKINGSSAMYLSERRRMRELALRDTSILSIVIVIVSIIVVSFGFEVNNLIFILTILYISGFSNVTFAFRLKHSLYSKK